MRCLGLLAAGCFAMGADQPALSIHAPEAMTYDLAAGSIAMPLCWGPVRLTLPGATAEVRFTVRFVRLAGDSAVAATANDLLTLRSGWKVAVEDAAGALVDGVAWTWTGPVHGDGSDAGPAITLASGGTVDAGNALLALRQLCYANIGGTQASDPAPRRVAILLETRPDAASAWTADPGIDHLVVDPGNLPMPPLLRVAPVEATSGATAPLAIVDTAGWFAGTCTLAAAAGDDVGPAADAPCLSHLPTLGLAELESSGALVDATLASGGSWELGLRVSGNGADGWSLAAVPVTVAGASRELRILGDPPLEIDLAGGVVRVAMVTSVPTDGFVIVAHPGIGLSAGIPGGAITLDAGDLVIDPAELAAMPGGPPAWLSLGLRFTAGSQSAVVPWIVHLRSGTDG